MRGRIYIKETCATKTACIVPEIVAGEEGAVCVAGQGGVELRQAGHRVEGGAGQAVPHHHHHNKQERRHPLRRRTAGMLRATHPPRSARPAELRLYLSPRGRHLLSESRFI